MKLQKSTNPMQKAGNGQTLALSALGLLAFLGCSGRVVSSDGLTGRSDSGQTFRSNQAADANPDKNSAARPISLVSPPANETFLESISSAVDSPGATHYRAGVVDGKDASCANLTIFNKISEILTLPLGKAGEKTICLQPVVENGGFGQVSSFNLTRKELSGDGPELILEGVPQWFTAATNTSMSIISQDAVQFRYSFTWTASTSTQCKTLENFPWKPIGESISLKFEYDGPWLLCAEVRDRNGRKSQAPKAYSWTRDTVYPVMNPLPLPGQPTTESEFNYTIKGNLVDFYQYALLEGKSSCTGASYSSSYPVSNPLNLKIGKDGIWTVCVMTENKNGMRQQVPFSGLIEKVSPVVVTVTNPATPAATPVATATAAPVTNLNPVAKVSIAAVQVNPSKTPLSTTRKFNISGTGVTHYKSYTADFSTTCPASAPTAAATLVNSQLSVSFSSGGIKTVCIWGINRSASGVDTVQATATWFRFYNDTSYSTIGKSVTNPVAFTATQANQTCSCHDLYFESDWRNRAVSVSGRLRNDSMPASGWIGKDTQKAGLMAFLATISGYPVDMPYVIVSP
ncbi:MAG: hypothetical protein ACO3A4_07595 [Silvanigrellaceae bacterium]